MSFGDRISHSDAGDPRSADKAGGAAEQASDAGEESGMHYLVMDFVDGDSLKELIEDDRLTIQRSAEIVRDVALALHQRIEGIARR